VNLLLFVLEIFLVVAGIALVPARSELRVSRTRVIHSERGGTPSAPSSVGISNLWRPSSSNY
jgi:hypothetical protein